MKKFTIKIDQKTLVLLAVLLALNLIAGKFTVGSSIAKISPDFLIDCLIGMIAGPLWTAIVLGFGDIIGTLTSGAAYFPGFTLTALMVGGLYGFLFFRKKLEISHWQDWLYTLLAMSIIMLFETVLLNTFWITLMMPEHTLPVFFSLLSVRLLLLIQIPIKTILIMILLPALQKIKPIRKFLSLP